jgi:hypothetical protein
VALGLWSPSASADAPASGAAPRPNRAPKFEPAFDVLPLRSSVFGSEFNRLRVGRLAHIVVHADDPDGDALGFSIQPLPAGATLDVHTGALAWVPTAPGTHQLEFSVTDGTAVARRTITFVVGPNLAPGAAGHEALLVEASASSREQATDVVSTRSGLAVVAYDPDGDSVTITPKRLPAGARLERADSGNGVELHWRPSEDQAGEHELVFDVSDGELKATVKRQAVVIPAWSARESVRWLLLGGGPATFLTHGDGEAFLGGAFDVSLAALRSSGFRAARCAIGGERDECSASHHRFYAEFEVLDSMRRDAPSLFSYGVGYSASLEWNPARRYLIPHYGVEAGGLVRAGVGHLAQTRPYLGLHLFASDDVWVNAVLGYRVVPARLAELSGPTFGVKLVLSPW